MTDRPMRADARRSRDAILAAAGELFARRGSAVQMDEIAEQAGLGMGTVYRHFATKRALLAAIVGRRFQAMTELARAAERIPDPDAAFEALLVGYLQAAEGDVAFRYAILGPEEKAWAEIAGQKAEFSEIAQRILRRAVDAGHVRGDLDLADFIHITRGAMANMGAGEDEWRRYLALVLDGIRVTDGGPRKPSARRGTR